MPDLLEKRYTPAARLLGSLAIIIAYLTIASYQFKGGGRLLNILMPALDPKVGGLIICALVVLYTVAAGMMSIVALDLINGIMITIAILIAAPLVLNAAGGWSGLTHTLPETHFTLGRQDRHCPGAGTVLPDVLPADGRERHVPEIHGRQGRADRAQGGHRHDHRCHRRRDGAGRHRRVRRRYLLE